MIDLPLHFHFTTIFVTSFGHVIVALLYFMLVFCQLLTRIATRHWCTCIRTSNSDLLPKTLLCNITIVGGEINQLINDWATCFIMSVGVCPYYAGRNAECVFWLQKSSTEREPEEETDGLEEETDSLEEESDRPRFTLQELRDVLQERNELKAQVFVLQEELAYYKWYVLFSKRMIWLISIVHNTDAKINSYLFHIPQWGVWGWRQLPCFYSISSAMLQFHWSPWIRN